MTISLKVNGSQRSVPAEADTPLLYVLRNDLALNGAKFGCGLAQCGARWSPKHSRVASFTGRVAAFVSLARRVVIDYRFSNQ